MAFGFAFLPFALAVRAADFVFLIFSFAVLRLTFAAPPAFTGFAVAASAFCVGNSGVRTKSGFFATGLVDAAALVFTVDVFEPLTRGFDVSAAEPAFSVENRGLRGMLGNSAAFAAKAVRPAANATVNNIVFFIRSCFVKAARKGTATIDFGRKE
ncbi:hypothetical protein [Mesorhizobium sp. CN2-181]|uniref:hypothetical protein n=1 Tax=Mesorhizobium yinganensis TaxID=3157707 RepID=UPI0032B7B307